MAVSALGGMSGKFVPATEWTCSEHEYPQQHDCDCRDCDRSWDCDECATAKWIKTGEMRELSVLEVMLQNISPVSLRSGNKTP